MTISVLAHPVRGKVPPTGVFRSFQIDFSDNYASPGDAITAAALGMSVFYNVQASSSSIDHEPRVVPVNQTPTDVDGSYTQFSLTWVVSSSGLELANGAYPAGITGKLTYLLVFGR